MQTLVLLELAAGRSPSDLAPFGEAENQMVWDLYLRGTVRGMHLRADTVGAVLTLEVQDPGEADRVAGALPMVAAGLLTARVVPLAPFRALEVLFAGGAPR